MRQFSQHNNGFTLLELAMVLVIMALLVTGILAGRDLLGGAQARTVVNEMESYSNAITEFRARYFAYPGDMSDANAVFNTTNSNGDGNGQVDDAVTGGAGSAPENLLTWTQLALAGFVSVDANSGIQLPPNAAGTQRLPVSTLTRAGYLLQSRTQYGLTENMLLLGAPRPAPANDMTNGVMTPDMALSIDTKTDDASPDTGRVLVWTGADAPDLTAPDTSCLLGTIANPTGYNLNATTNTAANQPVCVLAIRFTEQ